MRQFPMNDSVRSVLDIVRPSLPVSLIDDEGYRRSAAVAERIPTELTTFWGFECRLGRAEPLADILFETKAGSQGMKLLAGHVPSSLDPLCHRWPVWRRLRDFAGLWAEPSHPFHGKIRNTWLEFDTAQAPMNPAFDPMEHPGIFFGPAGEEFLPKEQVPGLAREALHTLGLPDPNAVDLDAFMDSLPAGAGLFQVGLLFRGAVPLVRLCVNRLNPDAILPWLAQLGRPGGGDAPEKLMRDLIPLVRSMAVGLDLGENGPGEKIGIECYMDPDGDDSAQWLPVLKLMEDMGLCLPEKSRGVIDYPGINRSPLKERWSSDGTVFIDVHRRIHHLKVAIDATGATEAKIYLAVSRPGVSLRSFLSDMTGLSRPVEHEPASRNAWIVS